MMKLYFDLFFVFFKLGLFTFGGGYAMIGLLANILEENMWIDHASFLNLVAISQITPGPIAINAATFVGYNVAGVIGSSIATLSVFLPSFFICMAVSKFIKQVKYNKYFNSVMTNLRTTTAALLASVVITFARDAFFTNLTKSSILLNIKGIEKLFEHISPIAIIIFLLSIFLINKKVSIIKIILITAVIGMVFY